MAKSYYTTDGRICNICGEFKEWELFGKSTAGHNGKKSHCKVCNKFLDSMRSMVGDELDQAKVELQRKRDLAAQVILDAIRAPETSWCSGCKQDLPKGKFGKDSKRRDGLRAYCFDCKRLESRDYRENNPEKAALATKRWAQKNPDRRLETQRRHQSRPHNRIHAAISTRLSSYIKKGSKTTFEILGYSREELITHLERQFTKGMTWDNYGEWHVDHIVPVSSFKIKDASDPEVRACWCLSNLRPIWATENLRKNAKRIFLV